MPENREIEDFLALCLREGNQKWPGGWASAESRRALCDRVDAHGIVLFLVKGKGEFSNWPEPVRTALRDQARRQAFWEESHRLQLVRLLDALVKRRVPTLLMKGTAFAYSVYPDPALRRRGDSDLLVTQDRLDEARSAFRELGFGLAEQTVGVVFQETWRLRSPDGLTHDFDLHWRVSDAPILQKVLREDDLFEGSVPLPRLAENAQMTNPVHGFVQCCINQSWHEFSGYQRGPLESHWGMRLIWMLDIGLQARAFSGKDWDELQAFAIRTGTAELILRLLERMREVLEIDAPDSVRQALAAEGGNSEILHYIMTFDHSVRFKANWRAAGNWRLRLAYLRGIAFSTPGHLRSKYPDHDRWPIFALQIRRIAGNVCKLVTGSAK